MCEMPPVRAMGVVPPSPCVAAVKVPSMTWIPFPYAPAASVPVNEIASALPTATTCRVEVTPGNPVV